jgi:Zn-dependent protease with chaperone function
MNSPLSLARWMRRSWRAPRVAVLCAGLLALPLPLTQAQGVGPARLPSLGDAGDISLVSERRIGDSIMREIYKDPDYLDDPLLGEQVQQIWLRLMAAARERGELSAELQQRFAWEVSLIRDPSVNAFALPGGYLGVHLGLIATVANRNELASVLAHELTHVTQRHISRLMSRQSQQSPLLMGAMLLAIMAASKSPTAGTAMISGGQALAIQTQLNFSRDMEREADRVGFGVMADAGFDTQGFVGMFEKLQIAARLNDRGNYPYLRSHPLTTERIADMQLRQPAMAQPKAAVADWDDVLTAARARALVQTGIDGMRRLSETAQDPDLSSYPPMRQAAVLYAAVLSDVRLKQMAAATQKLDRLGPLLSQAAPSWWRGLQAEVALQVGQPQRALDLLQALSARPNRAEVMWLAQARLALGQANHCATAGQELEAWMLERPRDIMASSLLAQALQCQGKTLRAIRVQSQARWLQHDLVGAQDRLRAAQALVQQKTRDGQMERADHIEASIIDANLRELDSLRREQLLQR